MHPNGHACMCPRSPQGDFICFVPGSLVGGVAGPRSSRGRLMTQSRLVPSIPIPIAELWHEPSRSIYFLVVSFVGSIVVKENQIDGITKQNPERRNRHITDSQVPAEVLIGYCLQDKKIHRSSLINIVLGVLVLVRYGMESREAPSHSNGK